MRVRLACLLCPYYHTLTLQRVFTNGLGPLTRSFAATLLCVLAGAPSGPARDVDLEHQASQGEEPEDPTSVMTACIICLSAYQDEEVVRL